jgi:putative ABC transport system substrate-binding protein
MLRRRRVLQLVAFVAVLVCSVTAAVALTQEDTVRVVMVTFRGCEDACEGFKDYVDGWEADAEVIVLDVARDPEAIPAMRDEVRRLDPDLLVTWGTSVTRGMIGTVDDTDPSLISGIPTVFMIVADPVGAEIVTSYEDSGRTWVTGTRNRVPEATQMRVLSEYRPFDRIGVLYNDDELNALLKADEIRRIGAEEGFEVATRVVASGDDGAALFGDIVPAIAELAAQDIDFLYIGSSSFLLEHADHVTAAAIDAGVPVATAYEAMVRDSQALIALASPYYNVGQLAARQAERILFEHKIPGDLDVAGLDRFTVLVNIDTAAELDLYPPMLLLRYAEIIGGPK